MNVTTKLNDVFQPTTARYYSQLMEEISKETPLVGVYGTLRRGWWNFDAILAGSEFDGVAPAEFIGQDQVSGYSLVLRSPDSIPFLVPRPGDHTVVIELFKPTETQWARMDRLEGHPHWYRRVPVTTVGGQRCWLYSGAGEVSALGLAGLRNLFTSTSGDFNNPQAIRIEDSLDSQELQEWYDALSESK